MRANRRPRELSVLSDLLERANLRGRGGAAFPSATKLNAVAASPGTPIVVVNGAEGEPLSIKDRYLLEVGADSVLDGAQVAARAIGADTIVLAVCETMPAQREALLRAIRQRPQLNSRGLKTTVEKVAPGYVTGQETALINALSGKPAKPSTTPPYPYESGLQRRPTLVFNAETFVHIGQIAQGSYDGTRLVTLGGAVAHPGLVQIDAQTTIAALCQTAGGLTEPVQGVLLGGYAGTWTRATDSWNLTLEETQLREHGLTLGAGVVFVLGESACPVAETARVTRWMSSQSAGQCGPCVNGLDAIATALEDLILHGDVYGSYAQIQRWISLVQRRGACSHPDGVGRFVISAMHTFDDQFERHAHAGPCRRCSNRAQLTIPATARERDLTKRRERVGRTALR